MIFPPKKPMSDGEMPKLPSDWFEAVRDQEVLLCSATLLHAIKEGDLGSRVLRLYILGKALRRYIEAKHPPLHPLFPLKWFRKVVKPFFPHHFKSTWTAAIDWGLIVAFPESNAMALTSPREKKSWSRIFDLLGMVKEDVLERNSFTDIVWTTHTLIGPKFSEVFDPEWDEKREKIAKASVFMWGLNAANFFLTLDTFGRLFGVDGKTVMRWSQKSGEFSQRRSVPVIGAPWIPEWEIPLRPQHLKQVKKAIPNAETPEFKQTAKLLDFTRRWSENGHRTPYFLYFHHKKRKFILARRIPNHHKPKGSRVVRIERPDSGEWTNRRRKFSYEQYMKKPWREEDRLWHTPRQFQRLRLQTVKDRRRAHYESLDDREQAEFRRRVEEVRRGERMPYSVLDPTLPEGFVDLYPEKRFTDAGTWSERQILDRYTGGRPRSQNQTPRPIRNIEAEIAQSKAEERIWKQSALNGPDGSERYGINKFTTEIAAVWGRMKSEWEQMMPDRSRTVKWVRIYNLGHRRIVPKKRSITCSRCHRTVTHLPHPQFHTSCPHCKSVFAGVPGLAL